MYFQSILNTSNPVIFSFRNFLTIHIYIYIFFLFLLWVIHCVQHHLCPQCICPSVCICLRAPVCKCVLCVPMPDYICAVKVDCLCKNNNYWAEQQKQLTQQCHLMPLQLNINNSRLFCAINMTITIININKNGN